MLKKLYDSGLTVEVMLKNKFKGGKLIPGSREKLVSMDARMECHGTKEQTESITLTINQGRGAELKDPIVVKLDRICTCSYSDINFSYIYATKKGKFPVVIKSFDDTFRKLGFKPGKILMNGDEFRLCQGKITRGRRTVTWKFVQSAYDRTGTIPRGFHHIFHMSEANKPVEELRVFEAHDTNEHTVKIHMFRRKLGGSGVFFRYDRKIHIKKSKDVTDILKNDAERLLRMLHACGMYTPKKGKYDRRFLKLGKKRRLMDRLLDAETEMSK